MALNTKLPMTLKDKIKILEDERDQIKFKICMNENTEDLTIYLSKDRHWLKTYIKKLVDKIDETPIYYGFLLLCSNQGLELRNDLNASFNNMNRNRRMYKSNNIKYMFDLEKIENGIEFLIKQYKRDLFIINSKILNK